MASHKAFVDYITEQLGGAGEIRAKTMFGEYGLYCDGQFFAVICEDQLFLKCTPQGEAAFPHLPKAPPYPGARDSLLVEDVEDRACCSPPDPNHLVPPWQTNPRRQGEEANPCP